MEIGKIALVRATNIIPFHGVIAPISETRYMTKDMNNYFGNAVSDMLRRNKNYDLWIEEEFEGFKRELKELLPYSSDYNSMVLFSLNGLVPDDINNTFSTKNCAVIEDMAMQMDSEIISICPTDTAIKGTMRLSDRSLVLIREEVYAFLSEEQKATLPRVKLFTGDLGEAVEDTLLENGYQAESLSLRREDKGYLKSPTKEETIKAINDVASTHGIPQVLFFNIITGQVDCPDELSAVKDEFRNYTIVAKFYQDTFFRYLFEHMSVEEDLQYSVTQFGSKPYMDKLCHKFEEMGIDSYRELVQGYNAKLDQMRESGILPTPEEIVTSVRIKEPIDLMGLYNEKLLGANK